MLGHYDAKFDSIPRSRKLQGMVAWKVFCILQAAFNRWNDDERNVNVNRNDNDWNDNWWFAGLATLFISPLLWQGSFAL